MSSKDTKREKGIFGVRKSAHSQFRPFGRHAEAYPSDDSDDSDYEPRARGPEQEEDKSVRLSPTILKEKASEFINREGSSVDSIKRLKTTAASSKIRCIVQDLEEVGTVGKVTSSKAWSDMLPSEILLSIFIYCVQSQGPIPLLSRLAKVCRRWNTMCKEPCLYKRMNLSAIGKYVIASDGLLKQILTRGLTGVEELSLDGWIKLTDKGLQLIIKKCKNLKYLSLSNCEGLSPKFLNILAEEHCTRLTSVDISGTKIDHVSLRNMLTKYGSNMKELLMRNCKGFPGSTLLPMIQELCPNLLSLDLSGTLVRQIKIEILQESCPKLKSLFLANLWPQPSYVYSRHLKASDSNGFPDLEHLSLACDTQAGIAINDTLITRLLKTSSNLRVLDIRGCGRISVEAIENLVTPCLESLYLGNTDTTDTMVTAVLNKWSCSLQLLDLSNNPIRDDTLALLQSYSVQNLRSLDLTSTGVTTTGVGYVLKHCPRLEDLNLSSCRGLPRGLKQRYTGQRLIKLTNDVLSE